MPKTIRSTHIPESYQTLTHPSGLDIILYPMAGFSGAYALFATKYGSVDTTFKTQHDDDFVTVPEGIAHFLEHKMFESEDGVDAFVRYAATGASANAYTSFDRTAYLFSATHNFKASLEILLDFVTHPYFTPETVEKEQGIIGQEITMYQDNPDWQVFFGLLRGLYHNNPVAIDIAGTIPSIEQIDADLLYRCYNTFYNLHNMVLVVAGNFSPQEVLEAADKVLKSAPEMYIQRSFPQEPSTVKEKLVENHLAVAQPLFQIGFKRAPLGDLEDFDRSVKTDLLLEMVVGKGTDFYQSLYKEGLITAAFGYSSGQGRGYAYAAFGGESSNPKEVEVRIGQRLEALKKEGLSQEDFVHSKKAVWGDFISTYASVTGVAGLALSSYMVGTDPYRVLDILSTTTLEDLDAILKEDFDVEKSVLSVVWPLGTEKE